MIIGQGKAVEQFASAWAGRKLHHAWLLAGPRGVGKATFARAAARRVLAAQQRRLHDEADELVHLQF